MASPAFTRSYLPNADHGGVSVAAAGHFYRWRAEGYATTAIGPAGMPGKSDVRSGADRRIALWGDSQAEGLAVADDAKLFVAIERELGPGTQVFPLANSGDALGNWLARMPRVERQFAIDRHLLLIGDLADLLDTTPPPTGHAAGGDDPLGVPPVRGAMGGLTTRLPAAVVTAGRNLLTTPDGSIRRLRWRVGPATRRGLGDAPERATGDAPEIPSGDAPGDPPIVTADSFGGPLATLRQITERPIDVLYAPKYPMVFDGGVLWDDPDAELAAAVATMARSLGIRWIDATTTLRVAFARMPFPPHGFHNGRPGVGHLNAGGYRVLARRYADAVSASPSDW